MDLVGRQRELARACRSVGPGRGGILLVGPAGVGKTCLTRAVVEEVRQPEATLVLWVSGSASDADIPFGAFSSHVPEVGVRPGRQADLLYLLQNVRGSLARRAAGHRLIIAADDAHLLDAHSATLLFQLVEAGAAAVVASRRSDDTGPPPLRGLWKEGLVERIDLDGLSRPDSAELVRRLLGGETLTAGPPGRDVGRPRPGTGPASQAGAATGNGRRQPRGDGSVPELAIAQPLPIPVGGELEEALWQLGRGTPLYIRELVRSGIENARIVRRGGIWRLDGELAIGPTLSELMAERLDGLDRAEIEAVELVSLAGHLPLSVLERLVGDETTSSLQHAGLLVSATSVADGGVAVVRPGHPLIGQFVRSTLAPGRRPAMSRALAEAFEAEGIAGRDLLRILSWRLHCGDRPDAAQLLVGAAMAAAVEDWVQCCRLAAAAVRAGGGPEAVLALADAQCSLGEFPNALEGLDALGPEEGMNDDQIARGAVLRAVALYIGLGQRPQADEVLTRACARIQDRSITAWLEAIAAVFCAYGGRPADALRITWPLLEEGVGDLRAASTLKVARALALAWSGRADTAIALFGPPLAAGPADSVRCLVSNHPPPGQAAVPPSRSGGSAGARPGSNVGVVTGWGSIALALAFRLSGRLGQLGEMASWRYQLAVRMGNRYMQGQSASALGWAAMGRGRLSEAATHFREASVAMRGSHSLGLRLHALLGLAEVLALTGDAEGAARALEEARPPVDGSPALRPLWQIAQAWLQAAHGSLTEALTQLDDTAETARKDEQVGYEMLALHAALRLGSPRGAPRLAELVDVVEGPLMAIVVEHAAALADPIEARAGRALDGVAERYAAAELSLFAAETAAQACRAHSATGDTRRATASAGRAQFLLGGRDRGAWPLGLALALTPPELTKREKEVAFQAAQGMSSSAIAARLCLSVRTVETHLARIYSKLGISGRSELADALVPAADRAGGAEAG